MTTPPHSGVMSRPTHPGRACGAVHARTLWRSAAGARGSMDNILRRLPSSPYLLRSFPFIVSSLSPRSLEASDGGSLTSVTISGTADGQLQNTYISGSFSPSLSPLMFYLTVVTANHDVSVRYSVTTQRYGCFYVTPVPFPIASSYSVMVLLLVSF